MNPEAEATESLEVEVEEERKRRQGLTPSAFYEAFSALNSARAALEEEPISSPVILIAEVQGEVTAFLVRSFDSVFIDRAIQEHDVMRKGVGADADAALAALLTTVHADVDELRARRASVVDELLKKSSGVLKRAKSKR